MGERTGGCTQVNLCQLRYHLASNNLGAGDLSSRLQDIRKGDWRRVRDSGAAASDLCQITGVRFMRRQNIYIIATLLVSILLLGCAAADPSLKPPTDSSPLAGDADNQGTPEKETQDTPAPAATVVPRSAPTARRMAEFTMSSTSGRAPLTVQFTNQSDIADSFHWDFGDRSTATTRTKGEVVSHRYTEAGEHTVTLTATRKGDPPEVITTTMTVTVEPGPVDFIDLQPRAVTLRAGQRQEFTATAFDRFENHIPNDEAGLAYEIVEGPLGGLYQNRKNTALYNGNDPGEVVVMVTTGPGGVSTTSMITVVAIKARTVSAGDRDHTTGETHHHHRRSVVRCGSIPQLAHMIASPTLQATTLGQRAGVGTPRRNRIGHQI